MKFYPYISGVGLELAIVKEGGGGTQSFRVVLTWVFGNFYPVLRGRLGATIFPFCSPHTVFIDAFPSWCRIRRLIVKQRDFWVQCSM